MAIYVTPRWIGKERCAGRAGRATVPSGADSAGFWSSSSPPKRPPKSDIVALPDQSVELIATLQEFCAVPGTSVWVRNFRGGHLEGQYPVRMTTILKIWS